MNDTDIIAHSSYSYYYYYYYYYYLQLLYYFLGIFELQIPHQEITGPRSQEAIGGSARGQRAQEAQVLWWENQLYPHPQYDSSHDSQDLQSYGYQQL